MKHSFMLEPGLRFSINSKKARRKSFKKHRSIYNKIFRRSLKQNPELDVNLLKRRIDWEY
jgi:hypothetical protein